MNNEFPYTKQKRERFDMLSMRYMILVLFLLVSVVLVLVLGVGVSTYISSSMVIDNQSEAFTESILQQVKERADGMREEVQKVSIPIVINPFVQDNDLEALDLADYISHRNTIVSDLSLALFMKNYICSIFERVFICTKS